MAGATILGGLVSTFLFICILAPTLSAETCSDEFDFCTTYSNLCESEQAIRNSCRKSCNQCSIDCGPCSQKCEVKTDETERTCLCYDGYYLANDGKTCKDIDECASNPCTNPLTPICNNIDGSYMCQSCEVAPGRGKYYGRQDCCTVDNKSQCGKRVKANALSGFIQARPNWPWVAYIITGEGQCAGALIADRWIVAAAPCFKSVNATQLKKIIIILGTSGGVSAREQTFYVTKPIIFHPNNDIALVHLNRNPKINSFVSTLCLPNGETPTPGDKCYALGYGKKRVQDTHPLLEVDLSIAEQTECTEALSERIDVQRRSTLCARYGTKASDACKDLFGGPLVCQRCSSCDWYLGGITLHRPDCATKNNYSIYTKVEHFENWISEQTAIPITKGKACRRPRLPVLEPQFEIGSLTVEWSSWTQWSSCSLSCNGGTSKRTRACESGLVSQCTGDDSQSKVCNEVVCPTWSNWSEFSDCSKTCGTGESTRTRTCLNGNVGQDGCDGPTENERDCNPEACPKWSKWSVWTTCSKTCGAGNRRSTRTCSNGNIGQKGCNGKAERNEVCNTDICPLWSDWSSWDKCSVSCGGGTQSSVRECKHGTVGQVGCEGFATRSRKCAKNDCPTWSKWSEFSDCSKTCGIGESTRTRTCLNGEVGQDGCDDLTENKRDCNTEACPKWSKWSVWTTCSKTCGVGNRRSTRTCSNGNIGQKGCNGKAERNEDCNTDICPLWSDWSSWDKCSVSCGGGTQSSGRKCKHGTVGQVGCEGFATRSRKCAKNDCPAFTSWSEWSACSASCGFGNETRSRTCTQTGLCSADEHGIALQQARECNISACPEWSTWSPYSQCSVTCGNGIKERNRTCEGGNETCSGNSSSIEQCSKGICPRPGHCAGLTNELDNAKCNNFAHVFYCSLFDVFMDENCKATCCAQKNGLQLPKSDKCHDAHPFLLCAFYKHACSDPTIRKACQRTCGECGA